MKDPASTRASATESRVRTVPMTARPVARGSQRWAKVCTAVTAHSTAPYRFMALVSIVTRAKLHRVSCPSVLPSSWSRAAIGLSPPARPMAAPTTMGSRLPMTHPA